tara:strand:- start:400 stop:645 length:246 start_codon:yes stop_codon:yes gene_type:complete
MKMSKYAPKKGKGTGSLAKPQEQIVTEPSCNFCKSKTMQPIRIEQVDKCQTCGAEQKIEHNFPYISLAAIAKAEKKQKKKV